MALTSTTTYMSLVLPTPGEQLGPTWANNINTALTAIDSHDHSSGKGASIGVAGITIDGSLDFKPGTTAYPVINPSYLSFTNNGTAFASSLALRLYSATNNGELYWNDNNGNQVPITAGGVINASGVQANRFALNTTVFTGAGAHAITEADGFSVYLIDSSTAAPVVTLPDVGTTPGRFFTIKDTSGTAATYNITVNVKTSASEVADGATSYVISSNYGSATFISRGNSVNWYVV